MFGELGTQLEQVAEGIVETAQAVFRAVLSRHDDPFGRGDSRFRITADDSVGNCCRRRRA